MWFYPGHIKGHPVGLDLITYSGQQTKLCQTPHPKPTENSNSTPNINGNGDVLYTTMHR
jgi:hypothetical protein